jgi:PhnB protein
MIQVSTYLLFDGTCKQAMEFYQGCIGGDLSLSPVRETPMKQMFPPEMHDRIINASLKTDGISLSASDWMLPNEKPVQGNTVCLFVSGGSIEETKKVFSKLSNGANITNPLTEQPFGLYGALNDKFGVRWMFQAEVK